MSIAVLNQVYDEMRRLAIAGSHLASDDFRLKKLIPPLEKSGTKAPVFAKVAQAIQNVVDSSSDAASKNLLELSTLVTAILYTQGETGIEGPVTDIESQNLSLPTADSSARVLKPLIEALTTTGSGRLDIVRDAHERGAFKDIRLVKVAVAAIDDIYAELADFVAEHVLPVYGKAIYPELRATFDLKGKGGHVRRLQTMHEISPEQTHDLVEEALESGSKDVKIAALHCLRGSKDHLSYLLDQTKSKSKDVRRVAYEGIAEFKDKEVVETLQTALSGKDLEMVTGPISRNRSPALLKFLLEDGQRQFEELFRTRAKAKLSQQMSRLTRFLDCFQFRTDKKSDAFLLGLFEQREEIAAIPHVVGDLELNRRIATLFLLNDSKAGQKLLVETHESAEAEILELAMMAAVRIKTPKQVYDMFSPYFLAATSKTKNTPANEKQEIVRNVISQLTGSHQHFEYAVGMQEYRELRNVERWGKDAKLDPRWLDAAVKIDDLELVNHLARPKHKGAIALLSKSMEAELRKKVGHRTFEMSGFLATMFRIQHPQAIDFYLQALEKVGKGKNQYHYYAYWLVRLIPDLPKSAASKIEKTLPSLNEKLIDEIIPFLEQLKAK